LCGPRRRGLRGPLSALRHGPRRWFLAWVAPRPDGRRGGSVPLLRRSGTLPPSPPGIIPGGVAPGGLGSLPLCPSLSGPPPTRRGGRRCAAAPGPEAGRGPGGGDREAAMKDVRLPLRTLLACAGTLLMAAGRGPAAPPETPGKGVTRGPLKGLPSAPGPHVARIKALGDNSWLELEAPKADPKWGRARGRSWTAAMPLAPELR